MGMIGWIVLGVIVLVLLYLMATYNRLVRLRALVKEAFSGITVQLRRRADLIPNLVETVQGYAAHEREVFIARRLGFSEEPFYEDADPAIQSAPTVAFARPAA